MTFAELDEDVLATLDLLAFLNLQYGKVDEAERYYRFLLHVRPDDARLLRAAAMTKLQAGQHDEALTLCEKSLAHCVEKSRDAMISHLLLSDIHSRLERPDQAADHAKKYLALRADLE